MHFVTLAFSAAFLPLLAVAHPNPVRTPVETFQIAPRKFVARVEMVRVDFLPGQEMPEHMHTVPVVCFVSKGAFLVSIGTAPIRRVEAGQATLEPAKAIIHYFRNASSSEPAQLNCAFLAGSTDRELSVMLDSVSK
jgi:quercetin dioxygenase-like cupin family protein